MISLDVITIIGKDCTKCNHLRKRETMSALQWSFMGRWEPGAQGRLQLAALELFAKRGYSAVTIADIAEAAGLTKRTFFNHFPDKREILFAGASSFEESVVNHLRSIPHDVAALEAVVQALSIAGSELARYREFSILRRDLIALNVELRERDLVKMVSLTDAIAVELLKRRVGATQASLAAQIGISIFNWSYDRWISGNDLDLSELMRTTLFDVRSIVDVVVK